MAEINHEYERGFKDGLKSECLEELKPIMVGLAKGCTEAIKGIAPMLIDAAQLTIIQSVNSWIPCSERLPEKDTSVLIFASGHRVTAYYDAVKGAFRLTESNDLFYWASAVTHWMPLPEPPEEE